VPVIRAKLRQPGHVGIRPGQPGDLDPEDRPQSPRHILVTSSVNPSRATPHFPEIPRSVSITSMSLRAQPSPAAISARPYWLLVDSVCWRTWAIEDCRR